MTFRVRSASGFPLRRLLLLGGGLVLLWLALQWASTPAVPPASSPPAPTDSTLTLPVRSESASPYPSIRYLLVLLVLTAGAVLALYLHRRTRTLPGPALLRPVGQLSLGPGQQIRLVACGDELLILGVTSQQITLLKSLPLPPELRDDNAEAPPASAFARMLTTLSARASQTDHAS
ncbi:FliO/MopB family protein [Rhodothermus marinus]|uniref:FliO/MopB family protein n=1 Tax=Rhodothermus marinus TaxID=29549 RepID=UPI0037C8C7C1